MGQEGSPGEVALEIPIRQAPLEQACSRWLDQILQRCPGQCAGGRVEMLKVYLEFDNPIVLS